MANLFKKAEYDEIKNQEFILITFDENGKRILTYGGLSLYKLTKEIVLANSCGEDYLVMTEEFKEKFKVDLCNWDKKYFKDILAVNLKRS